LVYRGEKKYTEGSWAGLRGVGQVKREKRRGKKSRRWASGVFIRTSRQHLQVACIGNTAPEEGLCGMDGLAWLGCADRHSRWWRRRGRQASAGSQK
jgi:hypothetical protein